MTGFSTPVVRLGCPAWACREWIGTVFPADTRPGDLLAAYSQVFPTVEGNSTFYGLPSREAVARWIAATPPGFRFCLKWPRTVSHEGLTTAGARREAAAFRSILDKLAEADRLGPSFLQLPPTFPPAEGRRLVAFLGEHAREMPLAVEVRHHGWFDKGRVERRLEEVLREQGAERCLFDSRALYAFPPEDEAEAASQTRKPKSPHRTTALGPSPFLRFVGRNRIERVRPWVEEWADVAAEWIRAGKSPYLFCHTPDDALAPYLCRALHEALRARLPDLAPLSSFAHGETASAPAQLGLFDPA